jgi:hypothetical protein
MALTPCFDLSPADWISSSEPPWQQLVTFGPAGFPAYARLRFIPDPAYPGQSENEIDPDIVTLDDREQLRLLYERLAPHTCTPTDCYFCLWDGYHDIHGAGDGTILIDEAGHTRDAPPTTPAFSPEVLDGSRLAVPNRAYFLFHGPLSEAGDWGAAATPPGEPPRDLPYPALAWPADHAWCVASDIDPTWAGIGADRPVIDQLTADPDLDVVPADPREEQPNYR